MGNSSRATAAVCPDAGVPGPRLLDHALGMLLDHVSGGESAGWRLGPLVILSASPDAAAAGVRAAADARGMTLTDWPVTFRDGDALGRQITAALRGDRLETLAATLAACRLVAVDRIDRIAGGEARHALVHLFDVSIAAGASWCVSLQRLSAAVLGPRCASRFSGGIVVPAPAAARSCPAGTPPSTARVFRAVARHHGMPVDVLRGPARHRTVAAARSLAMYLARRLTGLSFQAIGSACGGRDHTTVLHGVRLCATRIARDPALAADVERIVADLSAGRPALARQRRRLADVGSMSPPRAGAARHRDRRHPA